MYEYLLVGWFDGAGLVSKSFSNLDDAIFRYGVWKASSDKVWLFRRETKRNLLEVIVRDNGGISYETH